MAMGGLPGVAVALAVVAIVAVASVDVVLCVGGGVCVSLCVPASVLAQPCAWRLVAVCVCVVALRKNPALLLHAHAACCTARALLRSMSGGGVWHAAGWCSAR